MGALILSRSPGSTNEKSVIVREVRDHVGGVDAIEERAVEYPVGDPVDTADGVDGAIVVADIAVAAVREVVRGTNHGGVQRDGHLGVGRRLADHPRGKSVAQQQVVHGAHRRQSFGSPGRVHPVAVAEIGAAPRLVECGEHRDPVAQLGRDDAGELGEPVGGVAGRPAAGVLEFLRQIPVVDGHQRRDAGVEERVHQPVVVVEARPTDRSLAAGLDPRPRGGEPVGLQSDLLHHRDVGRVRWYWSHATSPVSPPSTLPGVRANVSQIDGVRPSASTAPSTW